MQKIESVTHIRKWTIICGVFLLLSSVIVPISNINSPNATKQPQQASTIFTYGTTSGISGLDPLSVYDTISGMVILNIFEGLFGFDYESDTMNAIPRLASNMGSWNTEMTEWTIPLRSDVTWWDGSQFTASDAVWNLQRLNALATSYECDHSSLWFNNEGDFIIQSVQATSTFEIKLTLVKPWTDIQQLLAFWGSYFIKPVIGYENAQIPLNEYNILTGTGPYMLDSYIPGESIILSGYENYRFGSPSIPELKIQNFADSTSMGDAFLNEEIHMVRTLLSDQIIQAELNPHLSVENVSTSCKYFYHMGDSIHHDIRRAMQFAFDYEFNANQYYGGMAIASTHPIPIGMEGYNPDLPGLPYFNLVLARDYILNSTDPEIQNKITINGLNSSSTDTEWRAAAEGTDPIGHYNFTSYSSGLYLNLAENAKTIGVCIDMHDVGDWPDFLNYASEHANEMDFASGGWCPDYYDPVNMLEPLFSTGASSNWNGLANATIDANLDALHSLIGIAKTNMIDTVVSQIIVEQAKGLYFMESVNRFAWNSEIITGGISSFFNVANDKYFYLLEVDLSEWDSDSDGIPDYDETHIYHTDPENHDTDSDGLDDGEEILEYFTNPLDPDSDDDGFNDFIETLCERDPLDLYDTPQDTDGDGLYDGIETNEDLFGTDPNNPDTDGDGYTDYEEIWGGGTFWYIYAGESDPTDPSSIPIDRDGDMLSDSMELLVYNTNILNLDSDQDGLTDGDEVKIYHSDPNCPDSDNDGLTDGEEVNMHFTDPNLLDTDNDNLNDNFEIKIGTNPLVDDTDGDGYYDGIEVQAGSSPLDAGDIPENDVDDDDSSSPDDDTSDDDTSDDDTSDDDTSDDDTSDDDSDNPIEEFFNNIPGYSVGIMMFAVISTIGLLFIKKYK